MVARKAVWLHGERLKGETRKSGVAYENRSDDDSGCTKPGKNKSKYGNACAHPAACRTAMVGGRFNIIVGGLTVCSEFWSWLLKEHIWVFLILICFYKFWYMMRSNHRVSRISVGISVSTSLKLTRLILSRRWFYLDQNTTSGVSWRRA